jgi:inner membrane protein
MSEAGLRERTRLATATLVIGANLPDLDAAIYLVDDGPAALVFRRGWTHGILAMVLLPVLLAGTMLLVDRWQRHRAPALAAAKPAALLALAAMAVWSHPLLDWLNVYGVRLLMPFSERWFYGDALFIIDPWVWIALSIGVAWSRRRRRRHLAHAARPTRVAGALVGAYLATMIASGRVGAALVERQGRDHDQGRMVGPVPVTPWTRDVVRVVGTAYEAGRLRFGLVTTYQPGQRVAVGRDVPGATLAAATTEGRRFLAWARFPRFQSRQTGDSIRVILSDMRYGTGRAGSFAVVEIVVPAADR